MTDYRKFGTLITKYYEGCTLEILRSVDSESTKGRNGGNYGKLYIWYRYRGNNGKDGAF